MEKENKFDVNNKVHNSERLKELQALPLDRKIMITQARLIEWYKAWDNQCHVALSGGKDSSVLAFIAGQVCKLLNCKLILWFSDTGLEYPEIKQNVDVMTDFIREQLGIEVEVFKDFPKDKQGKRITFRQVLEKYGYPVISKQVSNVIKGARLSIQKGVDSERLKHIQGRDINKNGKPSKFNCKKYEYLLDAPFKISDVCCEVMKKRPAHKFAKEHNSKPIVATMAEESFMRLTKWYQYGCNAFNAKEPISKPMSFWTENDVLQYIKEYNIPIASIYGEIKQDENGKYYTTGVDRTGCMFCMYGIQFEDCPNRFQQMQTTHPKLYEYCMRDWNRGGLGLDEVLNYINVDH